MDRFFEQGFGTFITPNAWENWFDVEAMSFRVF